MKIQRTPNRWSCLPTAFAMVKDIPVQELINGIGHDGSEIVWPDLPEPFCRRSFHIQEIIDVVFPVTLISSNPISEHNGRKIQVYADPFKRLIQFMYDCDGVIIGKFRGNNHATGWDHQSQLVLDPNGNVYPLHNEINIWHFAIS